MPSWECLRKSAAESQSSVNQYFTSGVLICHGIGCWRCYQGGSTNYFLTPPCPLKWKVVVFLGRDCRKDLDYFPKVVNFYEDDKIFDLLDEYGPLGVTVYDCILTIVYSNGYYANLSKDKLSKMVIRKIGNKWIKSQKAVVQVIDYCADLGLFDKDLMLQNIITSVGIQKRYHMIAVKLLKRRLYSTQYWLLDENGEPLLNTPIFPIDSEENSISTEEISKSSEEMQVKEKESKRKGILYKREPDIPTEESLDAAFARFVGFRKDINKPLTADGAELIKKELGRIGCDAKERIAILDQSIMNHWTGVYPLKKKRPVKDSTAKPKNQFHNFDQRDTDYDALMLKQVREWAGEGAGNEGNTPEDT